MPDNSIDPMAIDEGGPYGGSGFGSGFGSPGPPEETGGGSAIQQSVSSEDEYARKVGRRRPMLGQPRGPAMDGPDPQMVQAVMHHFLQLLQGGMGGSLPMRAFAQGGVVRQPTIGLLGENGPEAVVPLSQPSMGAVPQASNRGTGIGYAYGAPKLGISTARQFQQPPAAQGLQPGTYNAGMIPWILGGANQAGFFGAEPPQSILDAVRQQSIADSQAQARSARLGLMGNASVDPSTYGFQALMSDLQGQQNTAKAVNDANLALRMKQMDFLQKLFAGELGFQQQMGLQREAPKPGNSIGVGPVGFSWS